ncbi:heavy-metal-associated domain-containing protein [Sporichthya polymorpha]|uniref:heavy-metal-associated domain-containing protein n=1 Tax=Sporichthya polymorpha TaxID=35751 RepID=UPI000374EAF0|nr:heavy-metal-associated domain-containing protein [Sporichthya polymorpha]
MALTKYRVEGMTCGHCVAAVTAELRELPGVEDVKVDLVPDGLSTVVVTSETAPELGQVRAAVDEAGYVVVEALT